MFKDKLKKLRTSKGLTQAQLAEKLFVSRSAIAKWEQGRGLPQEEMHLEGLKNIKTDSANSLLYKCTYYADIDSLNQFEEYAEYVYTFLLNSFEITYVGFGIDVALYGMFEDRDPDDLRIFIKRSDKLFDYATYQENSVSYKFYYLTSNHVQHEKGKQIDPYVISLNYSYDSSRLAWGLKIDDVLEVKNFYMSIYKTSISESEKYKSGFYVFDDYFYLEETELNNENILDYFDIDISKSSNEYRYQIVPKNFIFKYYFKAHLTIYESENIIESKEQIITRGFNTIKLMSPQIIVSRPIKEIELDTSLLPEKVIRGSEVDLSGLKVKLSYADDLENNIVFLSPEDYDISEGVIDPKNLLNYTITYLDPYTKEVATANFSIKTVIVIGIRVDLSTSKTECQYGESLSLAGLSVYQIFDDETEALLQEGDYEINFGGYSANEPGEYQITITYQEFTENFKVKVLARQVESLRLSLAEIKTTYQAGETLDLSGLRVYAVYADASEERLSEGDYTVDESEFDNTKAGEYKIKVSYGGKTAEFTVTVQVAKKGCRSFFGTSFALSLGLLASVFFVLRRRK